MVEVLLILLGALLSIALGFIMKLTEIHLQKKIELNKVTRDELMELYLLIEKLRGIVSIYYPNSSISRMTETTTEYFMKKIELYNCYQRAQIYFKINTKFDEHIKDFTKNYKAGLKYLGNPNPQKEVYREKYIVIQSQSLKKACDVLIKPLILKLKDLTNLKGYDDLSE